ncbi:hypothetical protein [Glaciecola punicea]|uniref:hypothetical protein n=1 Tax=Glaciecola punicea TaxID=56804 RepID=UPI003CC7CCC7
MKHYEGLTCFCRIETAKLQNNEIEAMLKIIVRDRKKCDVPSQSNWGDYRGYRHLIYCHRQ